MGKQRPRFNSKTRSVHTPSKTVNYENWVKLCYKQQCKGEKLTGQIIANIMAYYPIPPSASKAKKDRMISNLDRPTKKPDVDNIAKIILDSLNNIAYDDDKQVISCCISKWYSNVPRVEVELAGVRDERD